MKIDKPLSTFEAFCEIIAERAAACDGLAILLTESVPECRELAAIPAEKTWYFAMMTSRKPYRSVWMYITHRPSR